MRTDLLYLKKGANDADNEVDDGNITWTLSASHSGGWAGGGGVIRKKKDGMELKDRKRQRDRQKWLDDKCFIWNINWSE